MSRNVTNRYIYPYHLHPNFRTRKYYYQNFMDGGYPIVFTNSGTTGLTTLLAGATTVNTVNQVIFPGGPLVWDYYSTTAQTNVFVSTPGSGLEISGDEVNNEALELIPGGITSSSRVAFQLGTDSDFFIKAKFKFTDASGPDQFGIGFRKNEAGTAATSFLSGGDPLYTDIVLFGFAGAAAAANPVRISTDFNNTGTAVVTDTNFTWADGLAHTLEVRVVGKRCLFFINGVRMGDTISKDGDGNAITAQTTFSGPAFDWTNSAGSTLATASNWLIPYIFLRHDTDVANETYLQEIEIGHLVDVGKDPNAEQVLVVS